MKRIEEKDVLSKLVQHLCEEFDVRLLAIDSGLRFLMDVPVEEWKGVKELQEKLQKILEDALLSKQEKEEVTWTEVTSCSTQTGDADAVSTYHFCRCVDRQTQTSRDFPNLILVSANDLAGKG
nr:hypothetical protein BaRGS_006844 [Batillaria attramentaria]